mgnify:CR=1 FL=1
MEGALLKTLENIINYKTAPLVQWEPVIGEELSPGKKREDILTHNAIISELWNMNAQQVTGIIADEGRLELDIAAQNSKVQRVTHLTLLGTFAIAARNNWVRAQNEGRPNADKVRIATDIESIRENSQDAVVMNMILGCLAMPEAHDNIVNMLKFAHSLLRKDCPEPGSLIIVRPNPEGGSFETYECLTPESELKAGADYHFIVKGLEEFGAMKNLYTPDSFLKIAMNKAGFDMGATRLIAGDDVSSWKESPFLLNVCELR